MPDMLVAENLTPDISEVPQYESKFNEGDTGELRLYLENNLADSQIEALQQDILSKGVILTEPISQDARILIIKFRKAIEPLFLISSSVGLVVNVLVGWQIYKTSDVAIPSWLWYVLGGLILLNIAGARKRGKV